MSVHHPVPGNSLATLTATSSLPALGPEPRADRVPLPELRRQLDALLQEMALEQRRADTVRALIFLWHDHFDASHELSQDIPTADGSFAHGILHRREPDYWNAKYWFNRVGAHPAFAEIARQTETLLTAAADTALRPRLLAQGRWQPDVFVDLCEENAAMPKDSPRVRLLREIQAAETRALLAYLCR